MDNLPDKKTFFWTGHPPTPKKFLQLADLKNIHGIVVGWVGYLYKLTSEIATVFRQRIKI